MASNKGFGTLAHGVHFHEGHLIHLAGELALVCVHVELAEHVAWRQRHDSCVRNNRPCNQSHDGENVLKNT